MKSHNITQLSTPSHPSNGENRTLYRSENSPCERALKGAITWCIFNPRAELGPVDRVEISALLAIQNSIKIERAIT